MLEQEPELPIEPWFAPQWKYAYFRLGRRLAIQEPRACNGARTMNSLKSRRRTVQMAIVSRCFGRCWMKPPLDRKQTITKANRQIGASAAHHGSAAVLARRHVAN